MQVFQVLSLAVVASLLSVGYIQASPLAGGIGEPQQQLQGPIQQQQQQTQQQTQQSVKGEQEKGQTKSAGRTFGLGYEAPLLEPYGGGLPIGGLGYGGGLPYGGYQQPILPISSGYQAPIASSYAAPIQSYGSSYQAPIAYEQPIVQTYQQPIQSYSAPLISNYSSSYQTPIIQSSYSAPLISNYSSSYAAPIVSSYSQPIASSYSAPITSSYSAPITSSYSAPITSSYSAPITSSYSAPIITPSYSAPIVSNYSSSYSTPIVSSYSQPITTSYAAAPVYEQPIVQNYSYAQTTSYIPQVETYAAPVQQYQQPIQSYATQSYQQPIQSYATQSYQQPIQSYSAQTYSQPITSSYVAPVTSSYSAPITSSYSAPITSSYSAPIASSYSAPLATSYQAPLQSYGQSSYVAPVSTYQQPLIQSYSQPLLSGYSGNIVKRTMNDSIPSTQTNSSSAVSSGGAADGFGDELSASDSVASATYVAAPQAAAATVVGQQQNYAPFYQANAINRQYLDIQPEFTQSWADFYQPPVILPIAFRNSYQPFLLQQQQFLRYSNGGQQIGLQALGLGYINWNGAINPTSFYLPVQLPYYYRIPPPSPFYSLKAALLYQKPNLLISTYNNKGGVLKRSMSHQEAAPYQLLVDHLAAASDIKEIFTNVSNIECPTKPSDYTCPQMLKLDKEELKKKLCEYETVLTGQFAFVPDTEKAQTQCGAMKVLKQEAKNDDENSDLAEKLAVVLGKDCQLKSIMDGKENNDTVYMLTKTAIPSATKFILMDGTSIDLLSSQAINKEELSQLLKQCPKKSE